MSNLLDWLFGAPQPYRDEPRVAFRHPAPSARAGLSVTLRSSVRSSPTVSPIDVERVLAVASPADFEHWLEANAASPASEREIAVAIYNKASGRQTVNLNDLQEVALCHGWVDTQTKKIDDERYAIRFVPRRPGSNWSATNREMARRLLAQRRIKPAGLAVLPPDLGT